MVKRVLIIAGGTGGHVFPALTIARALQERGVQVAWLGSRRGIETKVIPEAGITLYQIPVSALRGQGLARWLFAPWFLLGALARSIKIVYNYKPDVVLGMGGFAGGPGCLAAWLLRKKLVIHEQNSIMGLTNKILARLADVVLTGFPLAAENTIYVGNPVRAEIAALPVPEERYKNHSGPIRVLIFGGSQGSISFNRVIPAALAELPAAIQPEVWHQTGESYVETTKANYKAAKLSARIEPFIKNMAAAYNWADLVICRSGAATVAELSAVGLPAILIPFPYAVDDHQVSNAQFLVDAKAAILMLQDSFEPKKLATLLTPLLKDRSILVTMAKSARALHKTDTIELILQSIL